MSKLNNTSIATVKAEDWLTDDRLDLLQAWARDGMYLGDIAKRIGISMNKLTTWRKNYAPIRDALSKGKEIVDYMVENALLKSALGYKEKEVKTITIMRYGKVVETQTEVTERDHAPNVAAIQMWLYNRQKEKWKNMSSSKNILEDVPEDSTVEIVVKRASKNEVDAQQDSSSIIDGECTEVETPSIEVNESITVRKRSKKEAQRVKTENNKRKKAEERAEHIIDEPGDDEVDLDYWPDDWEEDN